MKEQNFKFRESFGKLVEQMTDKQAGEFIKAACGYVFLHKPMESKDEFLKGVFVFVKDALDTETRDRENGKLGGAITAEKLKEQQNKPTPEEVTVNETNVVSQVIIVAADENVQNEKAKPYAKQVRPNNGNAYGSWKYAAAKKNDHKGGV